MKAIASKTFKFFSSVKLAVPLMLVLLVASAQGTILESRYNTEYASLLVYRSTWFWILLTLLWLNIFCATISRWPFKKHHTGFVITHIGLLTLLIGSFMTAYWGIDGQLSVSENEHENRVYGQRLVLSVREMDRPVVQTETVARALKKKSREDYSAINSNLTGAFQIEQSLPFTNSSGQSYQKGGDLSSGVALNVGLKSPMFQVSEWLHSKDKNEMRMGPALIRLKVTEAAPKKTEIKKAQAPINREVAAEKSKSPYLEVLDAKSGSVLGKVTLAQLKKGPQTVQGYEIRLKKIYSTATVADNKLVDLGGAPRNPTLELSLKKGAKEFREICFEKFPTFSINPKGSLEISFAYHSMIASSSEQAESGLAEGESAAANTAHGGMGAGAPPAVGADGVAGNIIEFEYSQSNPQNITLHLFKNGQSVLTQTVKAGETVQTPWMGMTITLKELIAGAVPSTTPEEVELQERANLPPSAIQLKYRRPLSNPNESPLIWLQEGEGKEVTLGGKAYQVYYGPDSIELPFSIRLLQFEKIDYPGTETAMSFQSTVQVNGMGEKIVVKMNEPLKQDGFTIYQSSYMLQPGRPPVSVFSINRDPGRPVKYFGSLILCLGIVIFTLMKSSWYRTQGKKALA